VGYRHAAWEAIVDRGFHRIALAFVALGTAVAALTAAENPQQAFARRWEGRTVVVRQPLYTLVYKERNRFGKTQSGKHDGLTVVTPFAGTYLQFDGRRGRDDITDTLPERLSDSVGAAYRDDSLLELETVRSIEPIVINRHDAGVELVVSKMRIGPDTVKLVLVSSTATDGDQDPLTSLTVKWPIPLSKSLTERDLIEKLIRQFVEIKPTP